MIAQTSPSRSSRFSALKMFLAAVAMLLPTSLYADWNGGIKIPTDSVDIEGKTFYKIKTPENLAWFASLVNRGNTNSNAILANDIVLTEDSVTTNATTWVPIGNVTGDSVGFMGIFDGNGYKISGLFVDSLYYAGGLFGVVSQGGVVKNLTVENAYIRGRRKGAARSGGVVGEFNGDSIVNCEFHGFVIDSLAGGIVGWSKRRLAKKELDVGHGAVIRDCRNFGGVSGYGYSGGIVGVASATTILDSRNEGWIQHFGNGGIVGRIVGDSTQVSVINNCVNNGEIYPPSGRAGYSGGIIGYVASGANVRISKSVNNGLIKTSSYAGGIIGGSAGFVDIGYTENKGVVAGVLYSGGFVGRAEKLLDIYNSKNKGELAGKHNGGFVGYSDTVGIVSIRASVNEALFTVSKNFKDSTRNGGVAAIGMGEWTVEDFVNKSDISGMYAGGFFGWFRSFESYTGEKGWVTSSFKIRNSINEGNIGSLLDTTGYVLGGIVGTLYSSYDDYQLSDLDRNLITNVVNKGNIYGSRKAYQMGGIVGHNKYSWLFIDGVENYGNIENQNVNYIYVGGILGYGNGIDSVVNSANYGNINLSGDDNDANVVLGGIVSESPNTDVIRCANYGDIHIAKIYGGFIAGVAEKVETVTYCVNKGRIEVNAEDTLSGRVAGIALFVETVKGCMNKGNLILGATKDKSVLYPIYKGQTKRAGNFSVADTIMINGKMVLGIFEDSCSYIDKSRLGLDSDTSVFARTSTEMQSDEFAWNLNTCYGKYKNSEMWSYRDSGYPVIADNFNAPIYRIGFWDDSQIIRTQTYSIGKSFTDNTRHIKDIPEGPDPSESDPSYQFGFWVDETEKLALSPQSLIYGDAYLYASYVKKDSALNIVPFIIDGDTIAKYVLNSSSLNASPLPTSSRAGRTFLGWYNGDTKLSGVTIKPGMVLVARYDVLYYTVNFYDDEKVLQSESLVYGEVPKYIANAPKRENAMFVGWTPEIVPVSGNAAYFAMFEPTSSSSSSGESSASQSSSSSKDESSSSVAPPSSSSEKQSSSSVVSSSSSAKQESSSSEAKSSSSEKSSSSSAKSSSSEQSSSSSAEQESSSSEEHTTVVMATPQKAFNLAVNGMTIALSNTQGGNVRIFDSLGHLVAMKSLAGTTTNITLQTPGNYIVRVNGISQSVTLK